MKHPSLLLQLFLRRLMHGRGNNSSILEPMSRCRWRKTSEVPQQDPPPQARAATETLLSNLPYKRGSGSRKKHHQTWERAEGEILPPEQSSTSSRKKNRPTTFALPASTGSDKVVCMRRLATTLQPFAF